MNEWKRKTICDQEAWLNLPATAGQVDGAFHHLSGLGTEAG